LPRWRPSVSKHPDRGLVLFRSHSRGPGRDLVRRAPRLAAAVGCQAHRLGRVPRAGLDSRRDRIALRGWILIGLVFGFIGDVALLGTARSWFLIGLVAFLIGHLAYVVAFLVTGVAVGPMVAAAAGGTVLILIGAVAFYLSDLAVARNRFVAPGVANRLWGLPLYYLAQLMLAWSVARPPGLLFGARRSGSQLSVQ
jgi:uncharacterized membrane protein YhhN